MTLPGGGGTRPRLGFTAESPPDIGYREWTSLGTLLQFYLTTLPFQDWFASCVCAAWGFQTDGWEICPGIAGGLDGLWCFLRLGGVN